MDIYNISILIQQAQQRWLKTNEIFFLLRNFNEYHQKNLIEITQLPYRPLEGQIYILNEANIRKKWKYDGHQYLQRKNCKGIREDVEKLKIGGKNQLVCYYSYVVNFNNQIIINRRIYKLINKNFDQNFIIIHYLNNNKVQSHQQILNSDEFFSNVSSQQLIDENIDSFSDIENFESFTKQNFDELALNLENNFKEIQTNLDEKIENLQIVEKSQNIYKQQLEYHYIVDYIPKWDYACGGQLMQITLNQQLDKLKYNVQLGKNTLICRFIRNQVLECQIPPQNEIGIFELKVICVNEFQIQEYSNTKYFEYKSFPFYKELPNFIDQLPSNYDQIINRIHCKLQLIYYNSLNQLHIQDNNYTILLNDGCFLEQSVSINQESFSRNLTQFFHIISQIFGHEYLKQNLDSLDVHGYALIHYFTRISIFLSSNQDFYLIVDIFKTYNLDFHINSIDGTFPLQISLSYNLKEITSKFIENNIHSYYQQNNFIQNDHLINLNILNKNQDAILLYLKSINEDEKQNSQSLNDLDSRSFISLNDFVNFMENQLCITNEKSKIKEKQQRKLELFQNMIDDQEDQQIAKNIQNNVQIIQKNVRTWILRRQFIDLKKATFVIQNYIRSKSQKNKISKIEADKLQNNFKYWVEKQS